MTVFEKNLESGHSLRLAGRFRAAVRSYESALRLAPSSLDRADALVGLAMARRGLCEFHAAALLFRKSLAVYRRAGDRDGVAFALYGLGGSLRFLGRYREALPLLEESLRLAPDDDARCFTLMARGGLYRMIGNYRQSLTDYRRARRLAVRLGNRYAKAYADCGIGNALRMQGRRSEALRSLRAADRGYRSIGDCVSRPYTLLALALLKVPDGTQCLKEAGRLFRSTSDRRGRVHLQLVRSVIARDQGRNITSLLRVTGSAARKLGLGLEVAHAKFLAEYPLPRLASSLYRRMGALSPSDPFLLP